MRKSFEIWVFYFWENHSNFWENHSNLKFDEIIPRLWKWICKFDEIIPRLWKWICKVQKTKSKNINLKPSCTSFIFSLYLFFFFWHVKSRTWRTISPKSARGYRTKNGRLFARATFTTNACSINSNYLAFAWICSSSLLRPGVGCLSSSRCILQDPNPLK